MDGDQLTFSLAAFSLYCVSLDKDGTLQLQPSIQASSECWWTRDCWKSKHLFGSRPQASRLAAISKIFFRSVSENEGKLCL